MPNRDDEFHIVDCLPDHGNCPPTVAIVRDVMFMLSCEADLEDESADDRFGVLGNVLDMLRWRLAGSRAEDPEDTWEWALLFADRDK